MDIRIYVLGVATALVPLLQATAQEEPPKAPYSGADSGIALVECRPEESSLSRRQRGALIDIAEADASFEIVLTAAHGLPQDPNTIDGTCVLVAGEDNRLPVVAMWRSDPRGQGARDDWAVLVAAGRLSGVVSRLRTMPLDTPTLDAVLSADAPVRLPLRFPPGERPCALTPSRLTELEVRAGLFAHNCVAWAGHSGSPVIVDVADEAYVLGLHIGSRWIQEDRMALEIGRYVDATVVAAVNEAIAHGRALAAEAEEPQGWLQRLFPR